MLAHHLQWHRKARLAPLFEAQSAALTNQTQQPKDRDLTIAGVLETLKSQRRNEVSVGGARSTITDRPVPWQRRMETVLERNYDQKANRQRVVRLRCEMVVSRALAFPTTDA